MAQSRLFEPLTLRGVTLKNRIAVSPMCQYSAHEGFVNDWHIHHLASFARGGAGLVFVEATGVEARGRITYGCTGIWSDGHVAGMRQICEAIKSHGSVPAIQLAHAGRKGSAQRPWHGNDALSQEDFDRGEMNWQTVAADAEPIFPHWPTPHALSLDEIAQVREAFVRATRRALEAGFEAIEVHGAHGYLLNTFFSPPTNHRDDAYGGDAEGRMRLPLEITEAVRAEWPDDKPLFYRVSATDDAPGGIELDDTIMLAKELAARGVDVVDCSSGGLVDDETADHAALGEGYQVSYAARVRADAGIATMAVGLIHRPEHAEEIVAQGQADIVAIGREMLRDPHWALHAAEALGADPDMTEWPEQYGWWLVRRKRAEGY
jgi:2,4-dienoyl-CoA reductase-like NADH-dependent reductase (Old Yellow Enzyme family)